METLGVSEFWRNKQVFITGHTGFKGSWLSLWLKRLGANVSGYALEPPTQPNLFSFLNLRKDIHHTIGDIRDYHLLKQSIQKVKPEIIIHMAAQPLVRYSFANPAETYSVNVMGTVNLLEAARQNANTKVVIIVTSDKCYEIKEWFWGYREEDSIGGFDPYSNSKSCAELITSSYRNSFYNNQQIALASVRAGNVIGGGDWAQDRIIPDIYRAIANQTNIKLRNPKAIRPWQHVLEPLSGYLLLAERCYENPNVYSSAWNFGPNGDFQSVKWIVEKIQKLSSIPFQYEIDNHSHLHEATFLKLDTSKANNILHWQPKLNLECSVKWTVDWHEAWIRHKNLREITLSQIDHYQSL